jgi:transcriptional regulator with XRE-family HTH domain
MEHYRTVEEWEGLLGQQVRSARIAAALDQEALAALADVSVGSVSSLERGRGSSLKTLVAVVRALGHTEWLESLSPTVTVSPLQLLRSRGATPRTRQRVRARRPEVRSGR